MDRKLARTEARKLIAEHLAAGDFSFSRHAHKRMSKNFSVDDVLEALRRGRIVDEPELRAGTWRYRVHAAHAVAVIAFGPHLLRIVTVWRR